MSAPWTWRAWPRKQARRRWPGGVEGKGSVRGEPLRGSQENPAQLPKEDGAGRS